MAFQYDIDIVAITVVTIVIILLYLMFLASRYRKFAPNVYVIHIRGGKIRWEGFGGRLFLLPMIDSYVEIPTTMRQTMLDIKDKIFSPERHPLQVQISIYWKVIDPKLAYTQVSFDSRSPDYVEDLIKTTAESFLIKSSTISPAEATFRNQDSIIDKLTDYLRPQLAHWGIILESIEFKEIRPVLRETTTSNQETSNGRRYCSYCGATLNVPDASICDHCGRELH